jgi:hypothetical protein
MALEKQKLHLIFLYLSLCVFVPVFVLSSDCFVLATMLPTFFQYANMLPKKRVGGATRQREWFRC